MKKCNSYNTKENSTGFRVDIGLDLVINYSHFQKSLHNSQLQNFVTLDWIHYYPIHEIFRDMCFSRNHGVRNCPFICVISLKKHFWVYDVSHHNTHLIFLLNIITLVNPYAMTRPHPANKAIPEGPLFGRFRANSMPG